MGLFRTERPPTLLQEHVQKLWDLSSRIKQLEDRFEAQLEELSKRYRRVEQSEARFEKKKASEPSVSNGAQDQVHPAIAALKLRQGLNASPSRPHPLEG